jgi:hypothetical protein
MLRRRNSTHSMKLRKREHFAKVPEYREDVIMTRMVAFFNIRRSKTKRKTKRKTETKEPRENTNTQPVFEEKEICESGNVDAFDDVNMISPCDAIKSFPEPILFNPTDIVIPKDFEELDKYSTSTAPIEFIIPPSPKTPFKTPPPSILSLSTRRKERIAKVEFVKNHLDQQLDVILPKTPSVQLLNNIPQQLTPSKSPRKHQEYPPNLNYFINYLQWPPTTCKL